MKRTFYIPAFAATAALLLPAIAGAAGRTISAHPAELLGALPKPPPGWEVTLSRAENRTLNWFICEGTRAFKKVEFAEGENPAVPQTTTFRLLDTGRETNYMQSFAGFIPDKEPSGPLRKMMIGSFPAIIKIGDDDIQVKLLADTRYLIEMKLVGQTTEHLSPWLQAFNFDALNAIPERPADSLPNEVTMVRIDELNPDINRTYTASVSGNMSRASSAAAAAAIVSSGIPEGSISKYLQRQAAILDADAEMVQEDIDEEAEAKAEAEEEARLAAEEAADAAAGRE